MSAQEFINRLLWCVWLPVPDGLDHEIYLQLNKLGLIDTLWVSEAKLEEISRKERSVRSWAWAQPILISKAYRGWLWWVRWRIRDRYREIGRDAKREQWKGKAPMPPAT